jgi:Zn-dependent peptidase ImmA (M78 family)
MLADVVRALDVSQDFWSALVGCSPKQLEEWLAGQRDIPLSAARRISKAIGVPVELIMGKVATKGEADRLIPPLWLKAREQRLGERSLGALAVTRLLVSKYDEALSLVEVSPDGHRFLLNEIRNHVDLQAPAEKQGQAAAEAFLLATGLGQGARGIGEVFRGALRFRGLLVLETPIHDKTLEGFCVPVGAGAHARPCLLANSFTTTWFRRNEVLLHELAHAIFDLDGATAVFDVASSEAVPVSTRIAEERADAFALGALLPRSLLVAVENRGFPLASLDSSGLAQVIAATHAEQRLIARAAVLYGLLSEDDGERLRQIKISHRELAATTYHAVGLGSVDKEKLVHPQVREWESRKTTFPISGIRLPIPFVQIVLRALGEKKITVAKAAELLMVTTEDLAERYGVSLEEVPA